MHEEISNNKIWYQNTAKAYLSRYFHFNIPFNNCTQATRWNALVIKVGVVCMGVGVSMQLKEEIAWAIDTRLWIISNKMLFKIVILLIS